MRRGCVAYLQILTSDRCILTQLISVYSSALLVIGHHERMNGEKGRRRRSIFNLIAVLEKYVSCIIVCARRQRVTIHLN